MIRIRSGQKFVLKEAQNGGLTAAAQPGYNFDKGLPDKRPDLTHV
jgi:hypothetical protein